MRLNGLQFQPEPLIRGKFLIGGNQGGTHRYRLGYYPTVKRVGVQLSINGQHRQTVHHRQIHNPKHIGFYPQLVSLPGSGRKVYVLPSDFLMLQQVGKLHPAQHRHHISVLKVLNVLSQRLREAAIPCHQPYQRLGVQHTCLAHLPVPNASGTNSITFAPGMAESTCRRPTLLQEPFVAVFLVVFLVFLSMATVFISPAKIHKIFDMSRKPSSKTGGSRPLTPQFT